MKPPVWLAPAAVRVGWLTAVVSASQSCSPSLAAPVGQVLPDAGYAPGEDTFTAPPEPEDRGSVEVIVRPTSARLQLLEAFPAWSGDDYAGLPVLVKAQGKFTTDHISMAGPWLKYRGHLENISGNLYLGAVNAYDGYEVGFGKNVLTGETQSFPDIAKAYHEAGQPWVVIGDENMGEGSSREHAAMEPRFRMGLVAIARSFARIHETNLKKQGMVPLTFADPADYDRIEEDDRVNVVGLPPVPGETVAVQIVKPNGDTIDIHCNHTFSDEQVEWFRAGSALNVIRSKTGG